MSRYGLDYYGSHPVSGRPTYYGELVLNEYDATPFTVAANGYGRARADWSKPGGAWSRQLLLRNSNGFPLDEHDGVVVLDEDFDHASRIFQDTGLTAGRSYYYALFVFDVHESIWRRVGVGGVLTTKDYGYTNRLFRRLPEVFKSSDYNNLDQALVSDEDSFLYRFLSVFGYQLDHTRTETEALRYILDARNVPVGLLPALAAQVGVAYEPELGARAVRRLVQNAVHLWSLKGTLAGVRELASIVTGYPATVRIGYNLALDDLDAGPDGDVGRWHGELDCAVTYRTNTAFDPARPAGDGTLQLAAKRATTSMIAGMNMVGENGRPAERLRFAIPVVNNVDYLPSIYVASTTPNLTATMRLQWLDLNGRIILSDPLEGDPVAITTDFTARPHLLATAPTNARFLEASLKIDGTLAAGTVVQACGFMVQEYGPLKPWQCAREVIVYLQAELINHVGNTSGGDGTAYGWSTGVSSETDVDNTTYLAFTPEQIDGGVVNLLDTPGGELVTVSGDVAPVEVITLTGPERASYDAGKQAVLPGQVWSLLAEARSVTEVGRQVRLGVLLYDGPDVVSALYSDPVLVTMDWTPLSYELRVDTSQLAYDSVVPALLFDEPQNQETYGFRHVALEQIPLEGAFFFDGSTPSPTGDYLWESVAFRSPSYFYSHRQPRSIRLREMLHDYLPNGACYALAFAQAVIPDSPRAIAGSDLDPAGAVPPPASGSSIRVKWDSISHVGTEIGVQWSVGINSVHSDLTVVHDVLVPVSAELNVAWGDSIFNAPVFAYRDIKWGQHQTVGAQVGLRWNDIATSAAQLSVLWGQTEPVALSDGLTTP